MIDPDEVDRRGGLHRLRGPPAGGKEGQANHRHHHQRQPDRGPAHCCVKHDHRGTITRPISAAQWLCKRGFRDLLLPLSRNPAQVMTSISGHVRNGNPLWPAKG